MQKLNKLIHKCRSGQIEPWQLVEFLINAKNTKYKFRPYTSNKVKRINAHNAAIDVADFNSPNIIKKNGVPYQFYILNNHNIHFRSNPIVKGSTRRFKGYGKIQWSKQFHTKFNDYKVIANIRDCFSLLSNLQIMDNISLHIYYILKPLKIIEYFYLIYRELYVLDSVPLDHNEQYLVDLLLLLLGDQIESYTSTIITYMNGQFKVRETDRIELELYLKHSFHFMQHLQVPFPDDLKQKMMFWRLTEPYDIQLEAEYKNMYKKRIKCSRK